MLPFLVVFGSNSRHMPYSSRGSLSWLEVFRFLTRFSSCPVLPSQPGCLDWEAPSSSLCYSLKLLLTSQKCRQGSRRGYHLPNLSQAANQPATHLLPLNEQRASLTTETSATPSHCLGFPSEARHGSNNLALFMGGCLCLRENRAKAGSPPLLCCSAF